jgi:hypothetical protein
MTFTRLAPCLVALATALVVAACGGSSSSAAGSHATPTAGPTTIVVPTFDLSSLALPSFEIPSFTGDEELEALLPDTIGGEPVTKSSLSGEEFISLGMGGAAALDPMLAELGASIDDLSVAIGSAGIGPSAITVFAYQIDGVSADRIFEGLQDALPSGGGAGISQQTVAGRPVTVAITAGETTYIYLASDVVFIIGGAVTPALVEDVVTQLPRD